MIFYILLLVIPIALLVFHLRLINSRRFKMVERIPGPKPLPIVGNSHLFSTSPGVNWEVVQKLANAHKRMFRVWMGLESMIFIYDIKDVEAILTNTTFITKNNAYTFLFPWIGTGLLASDGAKWKSRRRIITPTFHFKILESFADIFAANSRIFASKLEERANGKSFDVFPLGAAFALDNICESAMGVRIDAQLDTESEYVNAIKDMCKILIVRIYQPWFGPDFLFYRSKWATVQKNALKVIHSASVSTIRKRKQLLKYERKAAEEHSEFGEKKRLAFLDLLLESAEQNGLSEEDIREEVDTFMFEGHDTISSALGFSLYCLSQHHDVQEKVFEEQRTIFEEEIGRLGTYNDYQRMEYLERVLKESLRFYPSVPLYGRYMHEDFTLSDGVILPKGSQVNLILPMLHRDPSIWSEPNKFNPDNFLPDVAANRSPYAFVPFSAGLRNCIGQKYAMLELKAAVSAIIRRCVLLPCAKEEEVVPIAEVTYVPKDGIMIRVRPREPEAS